MSTPNDVNLNLFLRKDYDESYWTGYLAARPKYDDPSSNFYPRIFAYHDAHAGNYDLAHDIGTGPGQVVAVLGSKFARVIASDTNSTHLQVCAARNAQLLERETLEILHCSGEDLADHVPSAQADAVFSGEAIALMDTKRAVEAMGKILKPGGTAAVWYYGRPTFDGEGVERCQGLYDRIVNRLFARVIAGVNEKAFAGWKAATDTMASWLDDIAFPSSVWERVERHKWNLQGKMTFYDEDALGCGFEVSSEVGEGEEVVVHEEKGMWAEEWGVTEVRRFVEVNLPAFKEGGGMGEEVEGLFGELERVMGEVGREGRMRVVWPVVLVLATKR